MPPPSDEVPGLPWQVDELVTRTTRRDPAVRPLDAGAFLADVTDVRKELGLARVPVPTGRSTGGPETLRPTNRPTRPRHPSDPGDPRTEVLGSASRPGRGGRTTMLPGMGAGPTTDVGGRRPGLERARPGVSEAVRRRRARFAVAIVLLLAITIGAVGWWLGSGRWTQVPDLVGTEQAAAIDLLQEAGLDPDCCEEQFSEDVAEGVVISADPAGGEAIRGTDVRLVVSKGPERFVVDPAMVGRPLEEVEAEIAATIPVQVTVTQDYDNEIEVGRVTGFEPDAGTQLQRDQPLTIFVSRGHEPVAVPDVVSLSPEAATANLETLGFTVARSEGRSSAVDPGEVMAVTPGAGEVVAYRSTVTIQVSVGVPQVTVPDVTGRSEEEAVAVLQRAGLTAQVQTFITGDRVYRQRPGAGEVVDEGTTVNLLLSFG
jgi:eukaryotic-like serine/threonine-protein kinase